MKTLSCGAVALILVSGPAVAADRPAETPAAFWGFLDVRGGLDGGQDSSTFDFGSESEDTTWFGGNLGGAARLATEVAPHTFAQVDAWLSAYRGEATYSNTLSENGTYRYGFSDERSFGTALHLSFTHDPAWRVGLMGSLGDSGRRSSDGTAAIEAVHTHGDWRFYGQAGRVSALDKGETDTTWYVAAVIGHYLSPNLYLAANLGFDRSTYREDEYADTEDQVRWGAVVEYRHDDKPISAYLSYAGWAWDGSDSDADTSSGTEHEVWLGLRFHFRNGTLRQLHGHAGLVDFNPLYGDFTAN